MSYNPPANWTGVTQIKGLRTLENGDVQNAGSSTPTHYGLYYVLDNHEMELISEHENKMAADFAQANIHGYFQIYWIKAIVNDVAVNFFLNLPSATTLPSAKWLWHQHIFWHYEDQTDVDYQFQVRQQATAYQRFIETDAFYLDETKIELKKILRLTSANAMAIRHLAEQGILNIVTEDECKPL